MREEKASAVPPRAEVLRFRAEVIAKQEVSGSQNHQDRGERAGDRLSDPQQLTAFEPALGSDPCFLGLRPKYA